MINKDTAVGVSGLAIIAAGKKLAISAIAGTPLDDLVVLTNTAMLGTVGITSGEEDLSQVLSSRADAMEFTTMTSEGVQSPHDRAMDEYTRVISAAVCKHVSTAKNIVAPAVMEFSANVQKALGEFRSPAADFTVEVVDIPAPMRNAGFEESIAKYEGRPVLFPEMELDLPEANVEDMLTMMLTGSKDYDVSICEWFGSKDPGFFLVIWNNLFRDFKKSNPFVVAKMEDLLNDPEKSVDAALAIYLIARKLFEEAPANTGMTLEIFKKIIAQYRDCAGAVLCGAYTRYNVTLRSGTLVNSIANRRKLIRVNAPVYREWLNAGNTNEVLLGMLVTNQSLYGDALINAQKQTFLDAWSQYESYSGVAAKNNAFNSFLTTCAIYFDESLTKISEEEKALMASTPGMLKNITEYFKEQLSLLQSSDMQDLNEVSLRLICRSRFYYTEAEKILRGINEAVKSNPGIDIRQAALLSTLEYVADYVANQCQLAS